MVYYAILPIVLIFLFSSCKNIEKKPAPTIPVSSNTTPIPLHLTDNQDASKMNINTVFSAVSSVFEERKTIIPIAVNLCHDTDFEVVKDTEDTIFIDWANKYYKEYTSENRFQAPEVAYYEPGIIGYKGYLKMDIDIVNNSKEPLDIEELNINVHDSNIDSLPFVYICTEEEKSNTITFVNASCFDWKGLTFYYSLLKNGEQFNDNYLDTLHLDYFENDTTIDYLPKMITMGYNYNKVSSFFDVYTDYTAPAILDSLYCHIPNEDETDTTEAYFRSEVLEYEPDLGELDSIQNLYGSSKFFCDSIEVFRDSIDYYGYDSTDYYRQEFDIYIYNEKKSFKNLFYPFNTNVFYRYGLETEYYGYALLMGKIVFDNTNYCIQFMARIYLNTYGGFGGWSDMSDCFDVEFRLSDSDYTLRYPYTTIIEPYGAERVSLIIKAKQSSNHKFNISSINGNDVIIQSKEIDIHYMSPKNYEILEYGNKSYFEE